MWVYVRPNKYEPKRANITIFNWDLSNAVAVDLSGVLKVGDRYVVQDAQNFYGPAVAERHLQREACLDTDDRVDESRARRLSSARRIPLRNSELS